MYERTYLHPSGNHVIQCCARNLRTGRHPSFASALHISGAHVTPTTLLDLASDIYDDPASLSLAYLETKIDFYDIPFTALASCLLARRKTRLDSTYKGETLCIGSPESNHCIVLYDKGLQRGYPKGTGPTRLEARLRISKKRRPSLLDFCRHDSECTARPFGDTCLVDVDKLPLTKREKIAISKVGLTPFLYRLGALGHDNPECRNRKRTLISHAREHIILDPNFCYAQWSRAYRSSTYHALSYDSPPTYSPAPEDTTADIDFDLDLALDIAS